MTQKDEALRMAIEVLTEAEMTFLKIENLMLQHGANPKSLGMGKSFKTTDAIKVCKAALSEPDAVTLPGGYFYTSPSGVDGYFFGEMHEHTKDIVNSGDITNVKPFYLNGLTLPDRWVAVPVEDIKELERALCVIGVVGNIDGHDVIRRNSVLDIARNRISKLVSEA